MPPTSEHQKISLLTTKDFPYRQVLGSFIFLANYTRPDISFSVHYLARFQTDPQPLHWTLLQRILYYISKTSHLGIQCPSFQGDRLADLDATDILDSFVDADHAGDQSTRKSTTGFVLRFFGTPVIWCSRLQQTIAEHTTEAEYIALNEAAHEIMYLAYLSIETMKLQFFPVPVYEDNYAALRQACTKVCKGRLKHVALRYFKIKEYVNDRKIVIKQVKTADQIADVFTKALLQDTFETCTRALLRLPE